MFSSITYRKAGASYSFALFQKNQTIVAVVVQHHLECTNAHYPHLHLDINSTGLDCANQAPKIERNHRHLSPLEAEWNLNGCV